MNYYVYVLRSIKTDHLYIGQTIDLNRRLKEHNHNQTKSTKNRGPYKLLFAEEYSSRMEARIREKYLKSGFGREFIKKHAGIVPAYRQAGNG